MTTRKVRRIMGPFYVCGGVYAVGSLGCVRIRGARPALEWLAEHYPEVAGEAIRRAGYHPALVLNQLRFS